MENNPCVRCKYNNTPEGVMVCDECVYDLSRKDRFRPMTNADRIRNMTDEELVDVIHCPLVEVDGCHTGKSCALCILRWLRSPVEESEK